MDRRAIFRVGVPLVVGPWALWALFRSDVGLRGPMRWVGLVVAVIGLAGVVVSRYTLGRSFSIRAKATELVTTGIYSRIRNPIYVSGVIAIIGAVMMMGKPYYLAILAVIIPMQIIRAGREARVLEEKFGEEYREYRRRTWF